MKRLQAFLLTLLMLFVPLHAMAGKLLSCESLHVAASSSAVGEHELQSASLHEHDSSHVHDISVQMELDQQESVTHHAADSTASAEKHAGSCSVCASCPLGSVGIAASAFNLPPASMVSADIAYLAFHLPEIDPDLPDDPPRA